METILEKARRTGEELQLSDEPKFVAALGYLNVRVVAVLLNMPKVWESREFDSFEAVVQDCCPGAGVCVIIYFDL